MSWFREIVLPMLPLVVILALLLFAAVWARKKSEKTNFEKSMSWFFFYVYAILPISICNSIYYALIIKIIYIQVFLYLIAMAAIVSFLGLYRFKSWGWIINYILLLCSAVAFSISLTQNNNAYLSLIKFALFLVVWVLPNSIYFHKRAGMKTITNYAK